MSEKSERERLQRRLNETLYVLACVIKQAGGVVYVSDETQRKLPLDYTIESDYLHDRGATMLRVKEER